MEDRSSEAKPLTEGSSTPQGHSAPGFYRRNYCGCIYCVLCLAVPLLLLSIVGLVLVSAYADPHYSFDFNFTSCEQEIVCPYNFRGNHISFKTSANNVKAYLVNETPPISRERYYNEKSFPAQVVDHSSYFYWTFNLVMNSVITWKIIGDKPFDVFMVRKPALEKIDNGEDFDILEQWYGSTHVAGYRSLMSDEYGVVVYAGYGSLDLKVIEFGMNYSRYIVEGGWVEKTCTNDCEFDVDKSMFEGSLAGRKCIIVDMPCNTSNTPTSVSVQYEGNHTVDFWFLVVTVGMLGAFVIGSLLVCVVFALSGSKGVTGQTFNYNPVPTDAPAAN